MIRTKPTGHHVLVKPEKAEDRSKGGIWAPASVIESQTKGTIYGELIAVGPNAWKAFDDGKPWAKIGDKVTFAKYGGAPIEDPETREFYRILNDEDILGVEEE
jgi:co-chaperonin GroES (HSP10)